jgi:20S proteasome subunit alpha 5
LIQSITLEEAELLAIKILKQVMEEKLTSTNIQIATVTKADGFKILPDSHVESIIKKL